MKRVLLFAALALLTAIPAAAQPPFGGMGFGRQIERDPALVAEYSEFMVTKYKLSEEQASAVRELNASYVGKISFPISRELKEKYRKEHGMDQNAERRQSDSTARAMRGQFRNMENMSDEEREQMMAQMNKRMEEAQAAREQMEENQEEYESSLQQILDKSQFKAYKREVSREEEREQRRRESEMRRQFERGGFGGPPGGFGGGGFGGPGGGF